MRINIVNQNSSAGGGFDIAGAVLTGPLILAADPVTALEAVTKQYVDVAISSLNASHISTGTLSVARLPAFTGDFSSVEGTNSLTLGNTPVTPGSYAKVTVDAKGRVTGGSTLTPADIPGLDFSKFTISKPNSLAGYGITDGVKNTSDSVTGFVTAHAAPTDNAHAATKAYVDSLVTNSSSLAAGDTIRRTSSTTPTGFLRCNGGEVSKTTYPALYATVGDTYNYTDTEPGNGQPWRQQYQINVTQSENITGWGFSGSLPGQLNKTQAIVTKNRVYVLGGDAGSTASNIIYSAPINADGTLGSFVNVGTLPNAVVNGNAIITKNRVHLLGGYGNVVYTAPINADGTLGAWTTGTALPASLNNSTVVVTRNRVYMLGGIDNANVTANIYTAAINADGTLDTWSINGTLPAAWSDAQSFVTKNRVYYVGGYKSSNASSNVYTAPINADGTLGTWTTSGSLTTGISSSQSIVTKNRVYLFGGYTAGSTSTIYTAPVNADGTLGAWATGGSMHSDIYDSTAIVTSSRVYLLGGVNANNGYTGAVHTAPILGGTSDYSSFYNGSITATDPANFRLPDTTKTDPVNIFTFIKI